MAIPAHWPRPAPDTREAAWVYRIEGEPSYQAQITMDRRQNVKVNPAILATAAHVVNSIPHVVAAAPGLLTILDLPHYVTRRAAPVTTSW